MNKIFYDFSQFHAVESKFESDFIEKLFSASASFIHSAEVWCLRVRFRSKVSAKIFQRSDTMLKKEHPRALLSMELGPRSNSLRANGRQQMCTDKNENVWSAELDPFGYKNGRVCVCANAFRRRRRQRAAASPLNFIAHAFADAYNEIPSRPAACCRWDRAHLQYILEVAKNGSDWRSVPKLEDSRGARNARDSRRLRRGMRRIYFPPHQKRERGNNVIGGLRQGISLYLIIFRRGDVTRPKPEKVFDFICGQKSWNKIFPWPVLIPDKYLISTTGSDSTKTQS